MPLAEKYQTSCLLVCQHCILDSCLCLRTCNIHLTMDQLTATNYIIVDMLLIWFDY